MLILMLIMRMKFCVKESRSPIGLKKFLGPPGFPLQPGLGGTPHFHIFLMKALLLLLLLEVVDYSLKTKNSHKNFQQQNNSIFLGNLYKLFCLWCTILQELNFMTMKVCCKQKSFSLPLKF